MKNIAKKIIIYSILIAVAVFVAFPLVLVISSAFKTNTEICAMPERLFPLHPTLENFPLAWNSDVLDIPLMLFNSCWYTGLCVVITIITSSMSGYVFSRGKFRGQKVIFVVFSSLMFISMGSITIYPRFEILNMFHLSGSLFGLVILKLFGIPMVNIYMVYGFINALPNAIDEAAEIDGCGFIGRFFHITLPMLKPVIATLTILSFNGTWNEYMMPAMFTFTNPKQQTLIVGLMELKSSGQAATSWNLMFAGTLLVIIPVLIIFAFGNKYITKGIAAGGVKG